MFAYKFQKPSPYNLRGIPAGAALFHRRKKIPGRPQKGNPGIVSPIVGLKKLPLEDQD